MTIAHLSDLHFGRIAHDGIVEALVAEINARADDLVVLSGDLTQRARPSEFDAARAMLARLEPPTLVVPGNHDVYPWWRPVRRLWSPLRRYRQYVTDDLTPRFAHDGVAVLGISTAYGATIKGGRVGNAARRAIRDVFGAHDEATFKILVAHHHLSTLRSLGVHDIAGQAQRTLDAAVDTGVHLILCGHLHVSHVEPLQVVPAPRRIVVASAGTATSNRGRSPDGPTNRYNVVTVGAHAFQIEERRYVPGDDQFVSDGTTQFDRSASPVP